MSDYIIAVDFDGTLCENAWPGIGEARGGVIDYVLGQQMTGAKLILWTNRRGERLDEAVRWCVARGIAFDAVNENLPEIVERFGGDTRKVFADEYLDDKAVRPESVEKRRKRVSGRAVRTSSARKTAQCAVFSEMRPKQARGSGIRN